MPTLPVRPSHYAALNALLDYPTELGVHMYYLQKPSIGYRLVVPVFAMAADSMESLQSFQAAIQTHLLSATATTTEVFANYTWSMNNPYREAANSTGFSVFAWFVTFFLVWCILICNYRIHGFIRYYGFMWSVPQIALWAELIACFSTWNHHPYRQLTSSQSRYPSQVNVTL